MLKLIVHVNKKEQLEEILNHTNYSENHGVVWYKLKAICIYDFPVNHDLTIESNVVKDELKRDDWYYTNQTVLDFDEYMLLRALEKKPSIWGIVKNRFFQGE